MLKDLFSFLVHPRINDQPISLDLNQSAILVTKMILFYFGIAILSMALFHPILKYFDLFPERSLIFSKIPLSFKIIFFVPVFEEIIFRLSLKFSKYNLFLSLATLHFTLFYHTYSLIVLSVISFVIALIPNLRMIPETFFSRLELIWTKYFPFVFYSLAISFGLVHLSNFANLRLAHYLLFPLIVGNQIFMGLIFGYVRVTFKNGFIFGVLLHFLINLPFLWLAHQ